MTDLVKNPEDANRIPDSDKGPVIELGQWYWMEGKGGAWDWFGCVTHLGSNYAELTMPTSTHSQSNRRVHLDEFYKKCRREQNPESVIRGRVAFHQNEVRQRLGQIKEITSRLGIDPGTVPSAAPESRELSTFSAMPDMKKYKKALIAAKDKELPALFEEVKQAHEMAATWMSAQALPMEAMAGTMELAVGKIKDRIFNVSLYAGLTEDIEKILDGEPAPASEPLHLFQRLCYMDEESLVAYKHGGMEYGNIGDFDEWMAKKENFDRILPHPRSMVAFRVRRETKYREFDGSLSAAMIIIRLEALDKLTFLYIRNGGKLYRMNCDLDFGEYIFPSAHQIDLTEPMMADKDISDFSDIISKRDFDEEVRKWRASVVEAKKEYPKWKKENSGKDPYYNPYRELHGEDPNGFGRWRDYVLFNKSSVYFDDISEEVEKQIKYYNRIILILQGLFDRSDILHPHPPAKLWNPTGLSELVKLVYDGAGAIHYKEPPDFEVYKKSLNDKLSHDSFTIGQDDAWQRREAKIEYAKRSWRNNGRQLEHYAPSGDPGPGYIAKIHIWKDKKREALYRWTREARGWGSYYDFREKNNAIPATITVPVDKLFNVSAYKLGDFRQFFQDPRSRARYLQWAELLLEAEEWHAGNLGADGKMKKKGKKK